jgi:hypothetical protein
MKAITNHGIAADTDRENRCKLLEAQANPLLSMFMVAAGRVINAAKKGPSDTARRNDTHRLRRWGRFGNVGTRAWGRGSEPALANDQRICSYH